MKSSSVQRETFASKFGFLSALFAGVGGIGTLTLVAFQSIQWGSGLFWIVFIIGELVLATSIYIIDAGWGSWTRKAYPQTWAKISKNNAFVKWFTWFNLGLNVFFFVPSYVVIIGIYLNYLIGAPFKFWGAHPGGFFWDQYGITLFPAILALIVWGIFWFISYRSVNSWARFTIYARPITLAMVAIWVVYVVATVPNFWQGWGLAFDIGGKFTKLGTIGLLTILSQAMLWVFWRNGLGTGLATAYASYLPRGGDVNDNVYLAVTSDALTIFLAALFLPVLLLGVGIPPLYGGSVGLAFSGLPKVWNALGATGSLAAIFFYALVIPTAMPLAIAYWETGVAALMDKFGLPRGKTLTLLTICGIIASMIFALPIYDGLNGNSFGLTLIFVNWYWEAVMSGVGVIIEFILLFAYFKADRLIEMVNESSVIKLPKSFKYVFLLGFLMTLATLGWIFIGTSGILPQVTAGAYGTILGDVTAFYVLGPVGLAILAFTLGAPAVLALFLMRGE
jgi:NSS family neurotransmitter:Na+ symporter